MKSCIFAHFGVISLVYLFVCMYICYKGHNRCTQETFLIGSDVDVNGISALRSIPSGTIDINMKSCILNRHKLRVTNCDKAGISTVAICDLSQFVTKTLPWQIQSNNIENMFCVLRKVPLLTFDRNLIDSVLTHFRIICHMYCV